MSRIRNRIQNTSGTGGGGGDVIGDVVQGPRFGNDNPPVKVATALTSAKIQFDGITSKVAADLNELSLTGLVSGTSTVDVDTGTVTRNYSFGSDDVFQTNVSGREDWQNIANAEGNNNGSNATLTGNALEARGGRLNMDYENLADYTTFGFTVVSAHLDFYTTQSGTTLGNGDLGHRYNTGGAFTTLDTFTGNVTNNPVSYDITSAITSQLALNNLRAYVQTSYGIANFSVATCDAIVFRLVVTHDL